jgi:glycerate kinase
MPGAGAAGGLAGAFTACFGASNRSGIDRILDLTGFDAVVEGADLVITGEGKSDRQTLSGKVALGVLHRVGGIPVVLLSGRIEDEAALVEAGFSRLIQVSPDHLPLEEAMKPEIAKINLRKAADFSYLCRPK